MSIKNRLSLIRNAIADIQRKIDEILEKDDHISIAILETDEYAQDLFRLMNDFAKTANPVLKELGLDGEEIVHDIEEYVKILEDNKKDLYFATINLDANYENKRNALKNIKKWLSRLDKSIDNVIRYIDSSFEEKELEELFKKIDGTGLSKAKRDELKGEFVKTLKKVKTVCELHNKGDGDLF